MERCCNRRFGEHDETDLARETESFERNISKYEQQSSDVISDAIIGLSISRLSTYKSLRDEIINHSIARRMWTDPNAMQVVHVNVNQNRQVDESGPRSEQGQKQQRAAKAASPRREAMARNEERKRSPSLVNADTA